MPRPTKTFKSLDDDEDLTNILKDVPNDISDTEGENAFLDEVPSEDGGEPDDIQVSGSNEGSMTLSVGPTRRNAPPSKIWSDDIETKFKIGELVYLKNFPDQIFKVSGPCNIPFTYSLKLSGCDTYRMNIPEDKIRKAKPDSKWLPIWGTIIDPYRDWKRKQEESIKKDSNEVPIVVTKKVLKKVLKNKKKK